MYSREQKLEITNRVGITEEVDKILTKLKRKSGPPGQKMSKAKIVCNLVLKHYSKDK